MGQTEDLIIRVRIPGIVKWKKCRSVRLVQRLRIQCGLSVLIPDRHFFIAILDPAFPGILNLYISKIIVCALRQHHRIHISLKKQDQWSDHEDRSHDSQTQKPFPESSAFSF